MNDQVILQAGKSIILYGLKNKKLNRTGYSGLETWIQNLLQNVNAETAYVLLMISAFVENVVPPIPGDSVIIFGSYLISLGKLNFWGVYLSTTAGSILGFICMYLIGIKFGRSFLKTKLRARLFSENQIKKTEIWFANYGYWVIAGNRFLSGTRSVVSLFSGLFHLKWYLVLSLSALSALIWNGVLIYAGYLLGTNFNRIVEYIGSFNKVIFLILAIVAIFFVLRWIIKRKKAEETV